MNLTTIMTTQVIPADLNAFLYQVQVEGAGGPCLQ